VEATQLKARELPGLAVALREAACSPGPQLMLVTWRMTEFLAPFTRCGTVVLLSVNFQEVNVTVSGDQRGENESESGEDGERLHYNGVNAG